MTGWGRAPVTSEARVLQSLSSLPSPGSSRAGEGEGGRGPWPRGRSRRLPAPVMAGMLKISVPGWPISGDEETGKTYSRRARGHNPARSPVWSRQGAPLGAWPMQMGSCRGRCCLGQGLSAEFLGQSQEEKSLRDALTPWPVRLPQTRDGDRFLPFTVLRCHVPGSVLRVAKPTWGFLH